MRAMSEEIKRIKNNNTGQTPKGLKTIIVVSGIEGVKIKLDTIKEVLTIFIENMHLENTDSQWEELLPEKFVKFNNSLSANDVLSIATIRRIIIEVPLKPIFRKTPVTLGGDKTACLILSSININTNPLIRNNIDAKST